MPEDHSITKLIDALQGGDDDAAARAVWERYFEMLVRAARRRLSGIPCREADEEDVALSAMNSFLKGAAAGRFPQLDNRDDLWKLLVTITARKVSTQFKRHFAEKRGGGKVRGESVFSAKHDDARGPGLAQVLGDEPTPQFAAEVAETCNAMLDQLGDDTLRLIAQFKLQGYTNGEIAEKLNLTRRSVERKVSRIRSKWEAEYTS